MQNGYSRIAIHLALLGDCHPSYFRGPHGLRLRIASPRELRAHPTSYKPHDRTNMPTLREGMPPVLYECPGHHDQEDLSMPIVTRSLALPALKSIDTIWNSIPDYRRGLEFLSGRRRRRFMVRFRWIFARFAYPDGR